MIVTETTVGNKPKNRIPKANWLWIYLHSFPLRFLHLFRGKRPNNFEIKGNDWYPFPTDGHKIERKIIAEKGFDDCIKFYRLRTTDTRINGLLAGKIFGDFHWEKEYGIFLRQFDDPDEWPISYLVFIDTSDYSYHRLKKVSSSWPQWTYEHIDEKDFNIITEYTDTYKTRLTIRK